MAEVKERRAPSASRLVSNAKPGANIAADILVHALTVFEDGQGDAGKSLVEQIDRWVADFKRLSLKPKHDCFLGEDVSGFHKLTDELVSLAVSLDIADVNALERVPYALFSEAGAGGDDFSAAAAVLTAVLRKAQARREAGDDDAGASACYMGLSFESGLVRFADRSVKLLGKPHQVLKALAKANGHAIQRDTLRDRFWSESGIQDSAVDQAVSRARRALRKLLGTKRDDPIPRIDSGKQLAWKLVMPA